MRSCRQPREQGGFSGVHRAGQADHRDAFARHRGDAPATDGIGEHRQLATHRGRVEGAHVSSSRKSKPASTRARACSRRARTAASSRPRPPRSRANASAAPSASADRVSASTPRLDPRSVGVGEGLAVNSPGPAASARRRAARRARSRPGPASGKRDLDRSWPVALRGAGEAAPAGAMSAIEAPDPLAAVHGSPGSTPAARAMSKVRGPLTRSIAA